MERGGLCLFNLYPSPTNPLPGSITLLLESMKEGYGSNINWLLPPSWTSDFYKSPSVLQYENATSSRFYVSGAATFIAELIVLDLTFMRCHQQVECFLRQIGPNGHHLLSEFIVHLLFVSTT